MKIALYISLFLVVLCIALFVNSFLNVSAYANVLALFFLSGSTFLVCVGYFISRFIFNKLKKEKKWKTESIILLLLPILIVVCIVISLFMNLVSMMVP